MLVYQHSPRCPAVLQHFLDHNPDYWCLVPMQWLEAKADDEMTASSSSNRSVAVAAVVNAPSLDRSPTFQPKPMFFADVLGGNTRSQEESIWLAKTVPKPPTGRRFSHRQIQEQIDFFKYKKESHVMPSNLVDLYNYAIVAVCKCPFSEFQSERYPNPGNLLCLFRAF